MGRIRLLDTFDDIATKLSAADPAAKAVITQLGTDPRLMVNPPQLTEAEKKRGLSPATDKRPDLRLIHTLDDKGLYGRDIVSLHEGPGQGNIVLTAAILMASRFNLTFYSLQDAARRAGRGEPTPINAFEALAKVKYHLNGEFPDAVQPKLEAPAPAAQPVAETVNTPPYLISTPVFPIVVRPDPRRERETELVGPMLPRTERPRQPAYA